VGAGAGVDEWFTPASWAEDSAGGLPTASLALIRMRDDEFDLPPLRAASG
jgi:hypothetical protein